MPLPKHTRNPSGQIRKERSDSLVANLKKEYPILQPERSKTLGALEKKYGVTSLDQVLKAARQAQQPKKKP